MKKKLIILGVIAALIITAGIVSGVWDRTPFYEIIEENGQHYLVIDPDWLKPLNYGYSKTVLPSWRSAKRAKTAILSGGLSLDELTYKFRNTVYSKNGKMPILDPNLICELKLPKGYRCERVDFNRENYRYQLSGDTGNYIKIEHQSPSEEEFLTHRDENLSKNTTKNEKVLKEYIDQNTDSQIRVTQNANSTCYYLYRVYSAESATGVIYIKEKYQLTDDDPFRVTGEISPDVEFFGISNGVQYSGKISDIDPVSLQQLPNTLELIPID